MNDLPGWVEVVVAFSALVTALAVLWKQVVQPVIQFVTHVAELVGMLPWLRSLKKASRNIVEVDKEKKP